MDITDKRLNKTILDGQEILLPTREAWEELERHPFIGDVMIYNQAHITFALAFTKRHPEFVSAIYDPGSAVFRQNVRLKLLLLHLYKIEERWQRVSIHPVRCFTCEWEGFIADVGNAEIYFGVPDRFAVERLAPDTKFVCPACQIPTRYSPLFIAKIIEDEELLPLFEKI